MSFPNSVDVGINSLPLNLPNAHNWQRELRLYQSRNTCYNIFRFCGSPCCTRCQPTMENYEVAAVKFSDTMYVEIAFAIMFSSVIQPEFKTTSGLARRYAVSVSNNCEQV
jgi:hypothetical protein